MSTWGAILELIPNLSNFHSKLYIPFEMEANLYSSLNSSSKAFLLQITHNDRQNEYSKTIHLLD